MNPGTPSDEKKQAILRQCNQMQPYTSYWSIAKSLSALGDGDRIKIVEALAKRPVPGTSIVKSCAKNVKDFRNLFKVFCEYGRTRWQWEPQTGMGAVKLLDGLAQGGECETFAMALFYLATAPVPLGIGLLEEDLRVVEYKGEFNRGFVLDERKLPRFAQRCNNTDVVNVFNPDGGKTTLTLWDNHKVIRYEHQLWDPSYGTKYARVEDCISYQIVGEDEEGIVAQEKGTQDSWMFLSRDGLLGGRPSYIGPVKKHVQIFREDVKVDIFANWFDPDPARSRST